MKSVKLTLAVLATMAMVSCGGGSSNGDNANTDNSTPSTTTETPAAPTGGVGVDLSNKGIGPVKAVNPPLGNTVDQALAAKGQELFKLNCTACHKPTKKFIGPAPKGILERRSPEWVMNMILNPEEMIANDPIAKQLLAEANGSPMANQHLTEEQARAVLEYFRTIE
ncbi:cytochrome c [Capnocytophaga gingivalis]|uniref:c-type cytochrome n=1 Tax=Capnocytophaga gingivalis TaxID=1017 RepID=UPI0028D6911F|nr:cytochrome c [Capnocytophaga gingivalis]